MATKKPTMVYEWSGRSYGVDPQVVGETVAAIERKEGACQPGRLVQEAEPETSPLHKLFTWDNDTAAEYWRTHEARKVIGCLVTVVASETGDVTVPAFVSVGHTEQTHAAGTGYRSVSVVMRDRDFANESLAEALTKLNALRRRYEGLHKLAPVWQAVDQIAAD